MSSLHSHLGLCRGAVYHRKCRSRMNHEIMKEKDKFHLKRPSPETRTMRMTVSRWDDNYVYGVGGDGTDEVKVCLSPSGEARRGNKEMHAGRHTVRGQDWTYLLGMLRSGTALNVIFPETKDGAIYPELIIFEPDFLINITSVARCFTDYAESPLVDMLEKLQPPPSSEAIILGNFASQLLDETLRGTPDGHSYRQSVKDFFKGNSITMLTVPISRRFHEAAERQKRNIENAVDVMLPQLQKDFAGENGMVEPSFFSELLGLQGRMDYLQSDFKFLIEQKSGKGEFPFDGFHIPNPKTEHYVQMLLYMLVIRYNYEDIYKANGEELDAYLLYSKYDHALLPLDYSTALVFRAMKIRNGIAWREMQYAKPGGFRFLEELTPDELNEKHTSSKLWNSIQRPRIERLLAPIHSATDLERAYYFRFLEFIANERMISKVGGNGKACSGFASAWRDSLVAKREAGNIYDKLRLTEASGTENGEVRDVRLSFTEDRDNAMSNFRGGDIVALYPYKPGSEPDIRAAMMLRSTIKEIASGAITLTLRAPQHDMNAFKNKRGYLWAIEHDFMESSYSPLFRGIHAFLSAPKERRDLLLLQREPATDTSASLKGDYGIFNDLVLRAKQAKDLFLIIGPPGTGKTSYGLLYTLKEQLLEDGSSALLASFTNRAVDEICGKLEEESIDYIRIGNSDSCAPEYKGRLLSTIAGNAATLDGLRRKIIGTRVIVGTTASLNSHTALFQLKQFSLCIVDEASQILEPHLTGLLSAWHDGKPAISKLVMIGDHKQLPAVVQQDKDMSRVNDPLLNSICLTNCRDSLFERLMRKYHDCPSVTYMLTRQGRMHSDIAFFPSQAFYGGKLETASAKLQEAPLPHKALGDDPIGNLLLTHRVIFLSVASRDNDEPKKVNLSEADVIASLIMRIYNMETARAFDPDKTIGVVVPFRNQIATIRNSMERLSQHQALLGESDMMKLRRITVDTVERFQGSQRKYIIYGFTAHDRHQLDFLTENTFHDEAGAVIDRKLNVVITRAQEHLIMTGDAPLLSTVPVFKSLMDFVRLNGGYAEVSGSNRL